MAEARRLAVAAYGTNPLTPPILISWLRRYLTLHTYLDERVSVAIGPAQGHRHT